MTQGAIDLREITPAEISAWGALLDSAFPVPRGGHFFDDFPVWRDGPGVRRYGVFGPGEQSRFLLSSAAFRPCTLRVAGRPVSAALIGGVATRAEERGKGHASLLVRTTLDHARKAGAAVAFLWGSEHALYQKMGFELGGHQAFLPLPTAMGLFAQQIGDVPQSAWMETGYDPVVFDHARLRTNGIHHQREDAVWYAAHQGTRWFRLEDRGELLAWAALDRGIDLPKIIHDWGGTVPALRTLFKSISEIEPEALLLAGPAVLRPMGIQVRLETFPDAVALVRILDPQKLLRELGLSDVLEISGTDPYYRLKFIGTPERDETYELSARELVRVFFGPFDPALKPLTRVGLPVPLWLWGLDSA